MSITIAALRQRIATATDGGATWVESKYPFEVFPFDASTIQHLAYAVAVPRTQFHTGLETRRGADGGYVITEVRIRWAHNLREDRVADYDVALGVEAALVVRLVAASRANLQLTIKELIRAVHPSGQWFIGEVLLEARHRLATA